MTDAEAGVALVKIVRWVSEAGITFDTEQQREQLLELHKAATQVYAIVREAEFRKLQEDAQGLERETCGHLVGADLCPRCIL
jgi:hypothetical protein